MRKSLLIMFLLFAAGITANAQKFALIDKIGRAHV